MGFGFKNAQMPALLPLEGSFAENAVEADLKRLFIDLFKARLGETAFDANVLGSAHLGSLDLVRKSVNTDGLAMLSGSSEEAATRYLYRAWKSCNTQGRGVHFLRTYLQMLFPNRCEVTQLWHKKTDVYPRRLSSTNPDFTWWLHQVGEPGLKLMRNQDLNIPVASSWGLGRRVNGNHDSRYKSRKPNMSGMFLTSRIRIDIDFEVNSRSVESLMDIIRSVIPARLMPIFTFLLRFVIDAQATISHQLRMEKSIRSRYPWAGLVVTDHDDAKFYLRRKRRIPVTLPRAFANTFFVTQRTVGPAPVTLKYQRAE